MSLKVAFSEIMENIDGEMYAGLDDLKNDLKKLAKKIKATKKISAKDEAWTSGILEIAEDMDTDMYDSIKDIAADLKKLVKRSQAKDEVDDSFEEEVDEYEGEEEW